jgi:hypothetical protein
LIPAERMWKALWLVWDVSGVLGGWVGEGAGG